jgi:hypothetical protein
VRVTVRLEGDDLCFDVVDDGAGFDTATQTVLEGHGFVNMRDRLGAIGGTLDVVSSPGAGTHIKGRIPHPTPIGEPSEPTAPPGSALAPAESPAAPAPSPAQVRAPAP